MASSAWFAPDGDLFWAGKSCFSVPCYPNDPQWSSIDLSEDGGNTETASFPAPCIVMNPVVYADALRAFAAGPDCPDLLRSVDGGRTWETFDPSRELRRLLHEGADRVLEALIADREGTLYGLAVQREGLPLGEILVSRDAGESWGDFDGPDGLSVTAIALDASGTLIVGTTNGVFLPTNRTRVLPPRD